MTNNQQSRIPSLTVVQGYSFEELIALRTRVEDELERRKQSIPNIKKQDDEDSACGVRQLHPAKHGSLSKPTVEEKKEQKPQKKRSKPTLKSNSTTIIMDTQVPVTAAWVKDEVRYLTGATPDVFPMCGSEAAADDVEICSWFVVMNNVNHLRTVLNHKNTSYTAWISKKQFKTPAQLDTELLNYFKSNHNSYHAMLDEEIEAYMFQRSKKLIP